MRVLIDSTRGVARLSATKSQEEAVIYNILSTVKAGALLGYGGRTGGNNHDPHLTLMFSAPDFKFSLRGSEKEDDHGVRELRDAIFFGGGGLIFLGHYTKEDRQVLEVCVNFCVDCGCPVTTFSTTNSQLCEECRAKCPHTEMEHGLMVGSHGPAGGDFCIKCKRSKKDIESILALTASGS